MLKGIDYPGITVVYLCHDGQGNYVLNKRSKNCRDEHGKWDCGGEAVEFGETRTTTLRRGVLTEYGTDIISFEELGCRDVLREEKGVKTHWIAFDYLVLVDREKVINGEPDKFDEIGWFTLDNFPQPRHSEFPRFLANYADKI